MIEVLEVKETFETVAEIWQIEVAEIGGAGQLEVIEVAEPGMPGPAGPPGSALPPISFAYGDASPAQIYTLTKRSMVISCSLYIRTAFDGAGAALKVGTPSAPEALLPAGFNDPNSLGQYENSPDLELPAGSQITLTITPGTGASQGNGVVVIELLALE